MKKYFLSFLIGIFFFPIFLFSEVRVYFSPQGGAEKAIVQHISKAKRSIDIAIYSFTSSSILKAVEAVKKERPQIDIRMIFDDAANKTSDSPGDPSKADRSQYFEKLGIDVRYVSKIMHHKFIIVDDEILFTGSGNFSSSAENRYDENFLEMMDEPSITTDFQKEFDLMWNYSMDFPTKSTFKKEYASHAPSPGLLFPYFTSQNFEKNVNFDLNGNRVVSNALEIAILHAKESIYVATGHFRFKPLADALIKAKELNPKLDIRVLVDSQEYVTKSRHEKHMQDYERCTQDVIGPDGEEMDTCELKGGYELTRYLSDAGIPLRLKYYSYKWYYPLEPQMHHKYMVIDGKEVFTGSYNWSKNAEFNTFENVIHVTFKPSIVDAYSQNFFKLWSLNRDRIELHKENLKKDNRVLLHFSPLTLSIYEVDDIRKILNEVIPGFFVKAKPEHRYWDKRKSVGEK